VSPRNWDLMCQNALCREHILQNTHSIENRERILELWSCGSILSAECQVSPWEGGREGGREEVREGGREGFSGRAYVSQGTSS